VAVVDYLDEEAMGFLECEMVSHPGDACQACTCTERFFCGSKLADAKEKKMAGQALVPVRGVRLRG
jgi:hypothetical protein